MSAGASAAVAASAALTSAKRGFPGTPKLALVFVSVSYPDADRAATIVREELGADVPLVGGTAGGCVLGPEELAPRGVSIVLVGGDDVEVHCAEGVLDPPHLLGAVPAAERVARAADDAARRGFGHYACLVFAPGIFCDGEALVAAVRKGAGARAQLAGGLTGDDLTLDRPRVLAGGELRQDRVVVTGLFTKKPVGIAARHGYEPIGPIRTVTRTDGTHLLELDGRPALDVWLEDARGAGASPPAAPKELALYLANHYVLGMTVASSSRELVARAPFVIRDDRTIQLSASIPEGTKVRILHATRQDLLRASTEAASDAVIRAAGPVAGAIVLPCSGRLAALGDAFPVEAARIRERIGAPIGGACVYGEIAKNPRDVDAFFNTTVVIIALGA
jgi:hypothetical protein